MSDPAPAERRAMHIDILTIFPEWFTGPLGTSLLGKAVDGGLVTMATHDLRQWTDDRHRTVDASPYGGGAGMVMGPDPFFRAAEALYGSVQARPRTLLMTPRGRRLDQSMVTGLTAEPGLLLLCGRYEGIDERVHLHLAHDEVSIGDVVLAGGEVAAAVVIEAVTRLLPGVMGNTASGVEESFSDGLLEHPQYTRPASYRGWGSPDVLRSGNHARVASWRLAQARTRTRLVRPDLLAPVAAPEQTKPADHPQQGHPNP